LTDFGPCPTAATWSSARTATPAAIASLGDDAGVRAYFHLIAG
jgi:hypothetical protein